jgi:hypothetical protein
MPTTIDRSILEAALMGIEAQKQKLDERAAEIRQMMNGDQVESVSTTTKPSTGKRRKFSPAAIQRMREAQRLRWQRVRGESQPAQAVAPTVKPKRKLSAAARAKLAANLAKARKAKAAKAKAARRYGKKIMTAAG